MRFSVVVAWNVAAARDNYRQLAAATDVFPARLAAIEGRHRQPADSCGNITQFHAAALTTNLISTIDRRTCDCSSEKRWLLAV